MATGTEFPPGAAESRNCVPAELRSGVLRTAGGVAESSVRRPGGFISSVVVGESANRKLEADMLSSRSAATAQEKFALLNSRRLPARLNSSEAALLLGFQEHDIPTLMAAGLLRPLGKPAQNAPKYFAAVEILARGEDRVWLTSAT